MVSRYQEDFLDFDMYNDCVDQFFGKLIIQKRQIVTENVGNVQRRHMQFQNCITMLSNDIEGCFKEGEEKHEILYFLKANWLRKTIQEK